MVRLYLCDLQASRTRPIRELKGFDPITLDASPASRVTFRLGPTDLTFYDNQGQPRLEPGDVLL
ncbi:fibronectin type III-like domain-contianing protein [Deinococcus sp. KSM4-11]|uniref:fibronectin type III-like domain-contianing protein n=1 Tax=Deinococcus sp. KSM4-11 TaxID=2568654 RepID=UPI001454C74D|nr:fibronectin type III-like domain-contianing protein [Deinococcus sp. KSM4-11]